MTLEPDNGLLNLEYMSESDFAQRFQAVRVGAHRRGIRMERIFWNALSKFAEEEGTTVARIVEAAEKRFPEAENITSVLRVAVIGWMHTQLIKAQLHNDKNAVNNLVRASPIPAIALTSDKKLLAYNTPFLMFIQANLGLRPSVGLPRDLRLILDVHFDDLIRTLEANENRSVRTGVLLGADEKRVRGTLSVVLAPAQKEATLLGYLSTQ